MRKMLNPFKKLKMLTNALQRFPLALFFTMSAAIIFYVTITTRENHTELLLTCAIGAFSALFMQMVFERFFIKQTARTALQAGAALLAILYYLAINLSPELNLQIYVRTSVMVSALIIAFIWIPVIKSRISFNESFIAAFKAFFHTLFYAGVTLLGCGIIIAAINLLIVRVSDKVMMYMADTILLVFAPVFFLSLIPEYPGIADELLAPEILAEKKEVQKKSTSVPKFLALLIEYIIIPLTLAFTVILVIYITSNIGNEFWTNNLLEPMLISYSITVIVVYILSGTLEKRFVRLFQKIFPKILVVIVLFQITASTLSLGKTGITHSRYFVIIFGLFAACAGIAMSTLPPKKDGVIALLFLVAALISIVPPTDAFSVSERSQAGRLKETLLKNNMLSGNTIKPRPDISKTDKLAIASSLEYLERMGFADKIEYVPEDFEMYRDFKPVFGFDMENAMPVKNVNVFLKENAVSDIAEYSYMVRAYISSAEAKGSKGTKPEHKIADLTGTYQLEKRFKGEKTLLVLNDSTGNDVLVFDTAVIFDRFEDYDMSKSEITPAEAAFASENSSAAMKVIVQFANIGNIGDSENEEYRDADVTVFVELK